MSLSKKKGSISCKGEGESIHQVVEREIILPSGKRSTLYGVNSYMPDKKDACSTAMISFSREVVEDVVNFLRENQVFPTHVQAVVNDLYKLWTFPSEIG